MLSRRTANIVFAIAVLIACAYFAYVAQGFETVGLLASSGLPSKFFPQLMLGFTGLCAVFVTIQYAVRGSAGGDEGQTVFDSPGDARRGLLMLAVAVLSFIIWSTAGFLPLVIAMGPLSLLAMGVRSVPVYIAVLLLTACVYGIFTQLLGVRFF